jgi:hypothetical protein
MRDGLQALAGKLGKPDLYHETVTVAFMALLASGAARKTFAMPDLVQCGGKHG